MVDHLLAIDDVKDDFEQILKWAIEFKRLWKQGDEVALNFMPLDTMTIGSIYENLPLGHVFHLKSVLIVLVEMH